VTIADRFDRRGEDWARFAKNVAGRFSPRFGAFRMPTHARRGLLILFKKKWGLLILRDLTHVQTLSNYFITSTLRAV
jgi:hypothetical protein